VATPWDVVARAHGTAFSPDGRAFPPPTFTRPAPTIGRPRSDYHLERVDRNPFEVAPGVTHSPQSADMKFMLRLATAKRLADANRDAYRAPFTMPMHGDVAERQFQQANAVRGARSFEDKLAAFKKVNDDGRR
jgi:hypothetical protein